ncbi:hypothetical protein K9N68_30010 [Kovacikia minuta CCNUW1]|uniref:hypothetical protein n=1 Tax=Kovacikia minuta TaxID=2931930 RepID=UPI001CCB3F53|nr:hypothetical protein [Kovacikia minuta]UBF25739.1 hypothetical protein K9N68_30010 [Kovacikia minuta CCNUW1]
MQLPKSKKIVLVLFLTLGGMGYFSAFSFLEVNALLKNVLVFLPFQFGVLVYIMWVQLTKQQPD